VHDRVVQVDGAWKQIVAALDLLPSIGVRINTNFVVCRDNFRDLLVYMDLLRDRPLERIRISLAFPKGRAREDLSVLADLEEVCSFVSEVAEANASLPNLHFDGFPGCLMPASMPSYELLECDIVAMQEVWEDSWYRCDQGSARHVEACRGCANETRCAGVHDAYLIDAGSPLRPAKRPVSNAIDYRLGDPIALAQGACAMPHELRRSLHPIRDIVVQQADGLRPAHTDTADFSLLEIRQTVHERGQLYLQIGNQAFIDDFSRELRLLTPSASCSDCQRSLTCPGIWVPTREDLLGRHLDRLRERLSRLTGRVLDAGRGQGRLDASFEALGEQIEYWGIDPDASAIERSAAAHPAWTLQACGVEELDVVDESFDTVLVLYSHNHFPSLPEAYRRLVAALRPGGTLIVCDNAPIAVVREADLVDDVRRAESAHPPEHYHNDYSEWVRPELEKLGLEVVEERPVVFGGASDWYLELRKPLEGAERPAESDTGPPALEVMLA
jgi:SAM-dependent methyltransferase